MAQTKQFQAESKRLLEMMVNSIYTHREIFLRELISNASDAIDKLYYVSLTDSNVNVDRQALEIDIKLDKENRTITVSDNGIGMTQEELENNLGIIANSGSLKFKKENEANEDVDIIGQFGVGFYSAFMVSKRVTVTSRAVNSDTAYVWQSSGVDGYTIDTAQKDSVGTEIVLELKDNTEDDNYDEYLDQYRIRDIVKKYSDYIRFPIKMEVEKTRMKPQTESDEKDENKQPEYERYTEIETLNSMIPLWRKNKDEVTDEEYNSFYKEKFMDFEDPLAHVHTKTEGTATYNALLFIPARTPFNYYTKEYEKGLQLYSNGVLIMDCCKDLLPDYFSFVKGLVDSQDLSLNISREMLQHDRQLKIIEKSLNRTIKNELLKMQKNDREKYETLFKNFGLQLKFGVYNNYGADKDTLKDLIMFYSSSEKKNVTLKEYTERMKEEQKYIYYAKGETVERIDTLPQAELVKDKGYEILYLTDDVDEFAIMMLGEYNEKKFKSISAGDLELETQEEKDQLKKQEEENKDMFEAMKQALREKVYEVRVSSRLKTHPVCLTSEGDLTLEMERVLNSMPNDNKVKAKKVLEINPSHPIFETLKKVADSKDEQKLKTYSELLYTQAMLIEGMTIDNPVDFSNMICDLMADKADK